MCVAEPVYVKNVPTARSIPQLMLLTTSDDSALQRDAVEALRRVVASHAGNQAAAAAAGDIPRLMQLTSSVAAVLQRAAVVALGCLVQNQEITSQLLQPQGQFFNFLISHHHRTLQ